MAILYTSLITSNAFLENVVKKNSELAVYRRVHRPPLDLGPAQRRPYPPAADRRAGGWRAEGPAGGRGCALAEYRFANFARYARGHRQVRLGHAASPALAAPPRPGHS